MKATGFKGRLRLLLLMPLSLLLTGCDIPENMEQFLGWRDKFFFSVTPQGIESSIGDILTLAAVLGAAIALFGILRNMRNGHSPISGSTATGLTLMFGVILVYLFPILINGLGHRFLPDYLTADYVINGMRWDLEADLLDMVVTTWAIAFTVFLPYISQFSAWIMLLISIPALFWSILGRNLKGVTFMLASIFGWALYLRLYALMVTFFVENYPDWSFAPVELIVAGFYTGAAVILMFACYVWLPLKAVKYAPTVIGLEQAGSTDNDQESTQRRQRDWSGLFAIPVPDFGGNSEPPNQTPPTHSNGNSHTDGDIVDGEFHEAPITDRTRLLEQRRLLSSGQMPPVDGTSPEDDNGGLPGDGHPFGGDQDHPHRPDSNPPIPDSQSDDPSANLPPLNESASNEELIISCNECGGDNPLSNTNCQYCQKGLDEEQAVARQHASSQMLPPTDSGYDPDRHKAQVSAASAALTTAVSTLKPGVAPVAVPLIQVGEEAIHHHIDKKAAGSDVSSTPSFNGRQVNEDKTLKDLGENAGKTEEVDDRNVSNPRKVRREFDSTRELPPLE